MIKVFKVDAMKFTPFNKKETIQFFEEQGILMVEDERKCNVFVSDKFPKLKPFMYKYGPTRKYLVWTREPRDNTCFKKIVKGFLWIPNVHIMNVYTGDVYINNYYENSYIRVIDSLLEPLNEVNLPKFKHKKIAALMIYRNDQNKWSLKRDDKEIDLCYLRTQIALEMHSLKKIDIYGESWPNDISMESSRRGENRKARKEEILKSHHFNLCFENTTTDYYCTEKIWDSIRCGCLPIYYGEGNKIYEDFPRNSFLDYCEFKNTKEIVEYIDHMNIEEFRSRMNLCINVFNEISKKYEFYKPCEGKIINEGMLLRIVHKIKTITNSLKA